jgi:hypothetical protein
MSELATPGLGRRRFVVSGIAATAGLILSGPLGAQAARVPTPRQTLGPYYPDRFPADIDTDLVVLRGSEARATGIVTHIAGRVLGLDGQPVAGARVEIWQCDANGRYIHSRDGGSRPARRRLPGLRARGLGGRRRLRVPDHPARGLSGTHAPHSFRGDGARAGGPRDPDVRGGRAPERARRASTRRYAIRASAPP